MEEVDAVGAAIFVHGAMEPADTAWGDEAHFDDHGFDASSTSEAVPTEANPDDFRVVVGDPKVVGSRGLADLGSGYVTYTVQLHTQRDAFVRSKEVVQRRFSDFEWLRGQLLIHYSAYFIPPLPEKCLRMGAAKYEEDFLLYRARMLTRFLERLGRHPTLQSVPVFIEFVSMTDDEWSARKKVKGSEDSKRASSPTTTSTSSGGGFFSNFFGRVTSEIETFTSSAPVEDDEWFQAKTEYLSGFHDALEDLHSAVKCLTETNMEAVSLVSQDWTIAVKGMANAERRSDTANQTCVQLWETMGTALTLLWTTSATLSNTEMVDVAEVVEDWIRMVAAVNRLLGVRRLAMSAFQQATAALKAKEDSGKAKASVLEEAQGRVRETEARYQEVTQRVRLEVLAWEQEKAATFETMLTSWLRARITYHLEAANHWKEMNPQ